MPHYTFDSQRHYKNVFLYSFEYEAAMNVAVTG